ncbi:MAG: diversity-generating retroelement protein Avd [Gammaproteobacteria bacterium]|nr:diversity-generating retroelement protein Avd [Gammaproteobacteria bacterium]
MATTRRPRAELPLIQKTYDLVLWMGQKVGKFPRDQKFLLGDRVQNGLLDFLGLLVEAEYSPRKLAVLERASVLFEKLRLMLRLCNDLRLLGQDGYRHASMQVAEIGRMLGGWLKQQKGLPA